MDDARPGLLFGAVFVLLATSIYWSPRLGSNVTITDLLFPVALVYVLANLDRVTALIGSGPAILLAAFLAYAAAISAASFVALGYGPIFYAASYGRLVEMLSFLGFGVLAGFAFQMRAFGFLRWLALSIVAFVIGGIATGAAISYYGIVGLPFEPGPSQTGFVFALSAIILTHLYVVGGRRLDLLGGVICALFVVASISRTAILGLAMATITLVLLSPWAAREGRRRIGWAILGLAVPGVSVLVVLLAVDAAAVIDLVFRVLARLGKIDESGSLRASNWGQIFNAQGDLSTLAFVTGAGAGISNPFVLGRGDLTARVDSLYVRLIFEFGVVGLVLFVAFFAALTSHIFRLSRDFGRLALCAMALFATSCVTHELFYVGKTGALFSLVFGLTVGAATTLREPHPRQ